MEFNLDAFLRSAGGNGLKVSVIGTNTNRTSQTSIEIALRKRWRKHCLWLPSLIILVEWHPGDRLLELEAPLIVPCPITEPETIDRLCDLWVVHERSFKTHFEFKVTDVGMVPVVSSYVLFETVPEHSIRKSLFQSAVVDLCVDYLDVFSIFHRAVWDLPIGHDF